jgi:hypothetical protein
MLNFFSIPEKGSHHQTVGSNMRGDLLTEVRRRAPEGRFAYLLIESTGIAEPHPVAATFDYRDENSISLSDVARLDTMVTVVDTVNLLPISPAMTFSPTGGVILNFCGGSIGLTERSRHEWPVWHPHTSVRAAHQNGDSGNADVALDAVWRICLCRCRHDSQASDAARLR